MTITRTEQDLPVRKRSELNRDGESRRVSRAVDAKRRLSAGGADGARTKADPHDPTNSKPAYLTQSHD